MVIWNPWHGCRKLSDGCVNCYVYRRDESIGKDASVVTKTGDYDLPLKRNRQKEYKLRAEDGIVFTCMTSDFFLEEADEWRQGCWDMIRERQDLQFHIITKRIERFEKCMPPDWGDGWAHITICCTCENQDRTDHRLPIFLELPIRHREIICEPMLGEIHMEKYLAAGAVEHVSCGGESGENARPCDFRWIQEVRRECIRSGVPFTFRQTGAVFIKDGRIYRLDRRLQLSQAKKSGYSYIPNMGMADAIVYKLPERRELFERLKRSDFRRRFHLIQISLGALWKGGKSGQELLHFGDGNAYISLTPSNENGVAELTITDGKTTEKLTAPTALKKGEWSKVTVRIIDGKGSLLINGEQVDSKAIALDMQSVMSASADDLALVGKGFKGAVDYIRLNSAAVSEPAVSYSGSEKTDDSGLRGDVNTDGKFNVADLVTMQNWLLAKPDAKLADYKAGDLCGDGIVNVFDIVIMRQLLLSE